MLFFWGGGRGGGGGVSHQPLVGQTLLIIQPLSMITIYVLRGELFPTVSVLKLVASRMAPSEYQKSVLEQLAVATGTKEKETRRRGLKRRPMGPNPLSVKRSSKIKEIGKSASSRDGISRNKVRTEGGILRLIVL